MWSPKSVIYYNGHIALRFDQFRLSFDLTQRLIPEKDTMFGQKWLSKEQMCVLNYIAIWM